LSQRAAPGPFPYPPRRPDFRNCGNVIASPDNDWISDFSGIDEPRSTGIFLLQ